MTDPRFTVPWRTLALTGAAMLAFAANSLLCRMALGQAHIDPASYTSIRIVSGAVTLLLLTLPRGTVPSWRPDWLAVLSLCAYMGLFSFAYLSLAAGTGALLLFGAVQLTMIAAGIRSGESYSRLSWAGIGIAFAGLVFLVAPGVTAPDPLGALLMLAAGVSWGWYSLTGRHAARPLAATAANFLYSVPFAALLGFAFLDTAFVTTAGLLLAILSGAIASGLGYAVWYAALGGLSAGRAATVQLSVPVITAAAGIVFLQEPVTVRIGVASLMTLGGIWLVLSAAQRPAEQRDG